MVNITSFQFSPKNTYANNKTYGHTILQNLADAICLVNTNLSIDDSLDVAGSFTEIDTYPRCTIGLVNSVTSEHIRLWYIYSTASISVSETVNTSATASYNIYKGNLQAQGPSSNKYTSGSVIIFGISNNAIDRDLGKDLGLKIPLQPICSGVNTATSWYLTEISSSYTNKITVISDGYGFTIIEHSGTSPVDNANVFIYHPQLIQTVSGDSQTGGFFMLSEATTQSFVVAITKGTWTGCNANGDFTYGQTQGVEECTGALSVSPQGNYIACVPPIFYTYANPYAGSTSNLNANGIGFKGYLNTDICRHASSNKISTVGALYGGWLHVGAGWLLPWATGHDADNPFVIV